ncbi:MAG: hypothetical protein K2W95_12740 [Candidatus Obscuribacterales bacterium]|nr:hypothetical protein [Candidatus Obscuribacterales bacterium]
MNGRNAGFLSIWCAGCAPGEEPYTPALLISESLPQIAMS